jgi:hypothetical protein
MTVRSFPTALRVNPFLWRLMPKAIRSESPFGAQALEIGVPIWEVELTVRPQYHAASIESIAFLESLNGYVHQLELWNLVQPAPRGTMRGTMTLNADAAQGATSIQVTAGVGQASTTVLKGDLFGLGSGLTQQVVRASADATANGSGVITIPIAGTPTRNAFVSGAAVTWDKPKALFRQKSLSEGIQFLPMVGEAWTLSLREDWRP